ncbi:hypothetical protein TcasGA2_TC000281 [Tribolium castaneum]|uniref:Uncharacterized protein n=1 Tax=Tribolium castaneum TaxID=7070 RepID=D6WBD4_TRICA|nr:hypothetical protein TcasGA2_TC000281 [Tribolium castaneum]
MKAKERRKAPEITPRLLPLLRSVISFAGQRRGRTHSRDMERPSAGFTSFQRHTSLVLIYSSRKVLARPNCDMIADGLNHWMKFAPEGAVTGSDPSLSH